MFSKIVFSLKIKEEMSSKQKRISAGVLLEVDTNDLA
jgi:hypothetical protein